MPFDGAPMHGDTELLLNPRDQFVGRQRRRCRALLEHEVQDGRRKFVRSVRATLAGNQSRKALLRNRTLGLIEGRPRQPERRGRFGDGSFVDLYTAEHLVLHLQQVLRIEEVGRLEQGIGDGLRMRIQDTLLAKRFHLCRISTGY